MTNSISKLIPEYENYLLDEYEKEWIQTERFVAKIYSEWLEGGEPPQEIKNLTIEETQKLIDGLQENVEFGDIIIELFSNKG